MAGGGMVNNLLSKKSKGKGKGKAKGKGHEQPGTTGTSAEGSGQQPSSHTASRAPRAPMGTPHSIEVTGGRQTTSSQRDTPIRSQQPSSHTASRAPRAPMGTPHFIEVTGGRQATSSQRDTPIRSQDPESTSESQETGDDNVNVGATVDGEGISQTIVTPQTGCASETAAGSSSIDPRILITIIPGTTTMEPIKDVAQSMRRIFDKKWFSSGYAWKGLSKDEKRFYFEEFKKLFRWDCNDALIYECFCEKARERYKEVTYELRTKNKSRATIDPEIIKAWKEVWSTPEFKEMCRRNSTNKRTEHIPGAGMSTHTGGSRSYIDHQKIWMRERNGRVPDAYDLFLHTHTKTNERGELEYSCEKARMIGEEVQRQFDLQTQQSRSTDEAGPSQPVDRNTIYFEVVNGKSKKQRVYGVSTPCAIQYFPESFTRTASTTMPNVMQEIEKARAEMEEQYNTRAKALEDKVEEQVKLRVEALHKEVQQQQQVQQQLQQQMAAMMSRFQMPWGPPPSGPAGQPVPQAPTGWGSPPPPRSGYYGGPGSGYWGPPLPPPAVTAPQGPLTLSQGLSPALNHETVQTDKGKETDKGNETDEGDEVDETDVGDEM